MPGSLLYLAMAAVAAAAWGCASPPKPTGSDGTVAGGRQTIHVEVANREPEGTQPLYLPRTESIVLLPGTNCSLSNDRGEWAFVTPADVSVELSEAPLRLHCRREGYPEVNRTLPCVTPRSEAMKAGVMASLRLASIAPAAAPVALGVGAAGVLLYFAAAAAAGAAAGSALSGPDADICRYSLSGAIQVVMAGPAPEAKSAQAGPGQAAAQPWEIDPALSNPTSLADIVNSGRGTIVYSHTAPGGRVTSHRAALRPSDGVLLALPQGYVLDVNHGMAALAGVRFSPPVPIVGKSLSPGAKWSHAGSLEEAGGLARAETTSKFEVVGKGPLATPAGTFTAIHVTEVRWQAGSRYRIERWIDELALVPLREEWRAAEARPAFVHGIGSFSMFDPPFPEGTIEIRFVAGPG